MGSSDIKYMLSHQKVNLNKTSADAREASHREVNRSRQAGQELCEAIEKKLSGRPLPRRNLRVVSIP